MISLRSSITQKLLEFYFLHEKEKFYINQLARILSSDRGNLIKKLQALESDGLFISEFHGHQRYYSLNKSYPLIKEYKKIILKTIGLEKKLSDAFSKIKGIKSAYIFGSYATNKMNLGSDIDILIIGNHKILTTQKVVIALQKQLHRDINCIHITNKEFLKKKDKDSFIKEIFSKPNIQII